MPSLRLFSFADFASPLQHDPLWNLVQQLNRAEEVFEQSSHETDEASDAFHDEVVGSVRKMLEEQPPAPTTVQGALFVLSQLARDAEMQVLADWAPNVMKLCLQFLAEELQADPVAPLRPFEQRLAERQAKDESVRAFIEVFSALDEAEKAKAKEIVAWIDAGEDPATDPRKTDPWWKARLAGAH